MTNEPFVPKETAHARWILKQSETALEDLLAAFDLMSERMLEGDDVALSDITKARIALGAARTQLIEEVRKYEERTQRDRGLVADAPLDFDALRESIGSKLDRLRDPGGAA